MATPSAKYWADRAKSRLVSIERDSGEYLQQMVANNLRAARQIRRDIDAIIIRFARNANLTIDEAKALLAELIGPEERALLLEIANKIEDPAERARMMAKVNAPAYRARIDRLEAVQMAAEGRMAAIVEAQESIITESLTRTAREMFNRTIFDIQQGTGFGFSFAEVTQQQIEAVLHHRWSGGHYSKSVWRTPENVAVKVRDIVQQNMTTGRSWRRCLDEVRNESFNMSNYEAARLLRTETAYVAGEMEAKAYEEADLEEYEYMATLDTRTSQICQELDGKRFKVKDRETGVNYPPMHPFCRSTTVAVIDGLDVTKLQQRARDPETGKNYLVPATMKYPEWYQKHIVDAGKEWRVKAYHNRSRDLAQYENYKSIIGKSSMPKTLDAFQEFKYQEPQRWELMKGYKGEVTSGNISPLVGFQYFEKEHNSLIEHFVGTKTSDGVEIKGINPHFTARKIVTHEWRPGAIHNEELRKLLSHKAVTVDAIEECLRSDDIKQSTRRLENGKIKTSKRYISDRCVVTANPVTGQLIQTNWRTK